ncbi:MAG TPA: BatD family protein [Bacteroidota bacterium]|nr:BatD family protein [Bacteroidota bacterium]
MNARLLMAAIAAIVVLAANGTAQNVSFEATVDRATVGLGEQFTLSFTVTAQTMSGGKNLQLPDLSKFHIMSGPNQSSSMQIINGAVSSSVTYNYVLQPKEMGKLTIGPASIEAGGGVLKSQPVMIEVVKAAPRPRQQAQDAGAAPAEMSENLFLRAIIDRSRVTQGEQINLVFKLYTRVSVVNYAVTKNPGMTGFWSEDVEIPKNITLTSETINGKSYRVGIIKRVALFPTQSGPLEIGPMEVQTTVQLPYARSNDPFDAFFRDPFGRNVNYTTTSPALKIVVDPLPSGAPSDFKGAIGQFAMSTSVDKKTTRTNEPLSLKVTLSGTGNIKLLEAPTLELPPDFEQYTPKVTESINRTQGRISGSKTFEYLMIPRYPGLKVIKPVTMSYYDLKKGEYVRLRSPQIELNVEQGTATPGPAISGVAREDVRMLSQDIRFIKTGTPAFVHGGDRLYSRLWFLALVLLPLLGVAGAYVYARQRQFVMLDQAGYRYRKAIKVAQKGLREAEYLLKDKSRHTAAPSSKQRLRFYSEVSRALWKYLGDKLNIPQASFSVEGAATELQARGVGEDLIRDLRTILETCDLARFAPTSLELSAMQKTYDDARRVIVELERTLKAR